MATPHPQEKLMIGGARFQKAVLDWTKQSNHLYLTVFGVALFVYSLYADKLSPHIRWQLSTTTGRALLLLLLYIVYHVAGWIPAVLFAIGIALTFSNRPLYAPISVQEGFLSADSVIEGKTKEEVEEEKKKGAKEEGFQDGIKKTKVKGHKWFVEEVLHENPNKIVQDRVQTFPVQD